MDLLSNQTLNITNSSHTTPIYVRFRPPEDANIPSPPPTSISPGGSDRLAVKDGTMNMFVWTDVNSSPMWKGIVPTKVKKPVIISPEEKTVLYDGIQIPEGFNPVTDLSGDSSKSSGIWTYSNYFMFAFLIILIVICLWFFWRRSTRS